LTESPSSPFDAREGDRERLLGELDRHGIAYQIESSERVTLQLPAGSGSIEVGLNGVDISTALDADVWNWKVSAEFNAMYSSSEGRLEVALSVPQVEPDGTLPIWTIKGTQLGPEFQLSPEIPNGIPKYSRPSVGMFAHMAHVEMDWAIRVGKASVSLEISPYSDLFFCVNRLGPRSMISLKLTGDPFADRDADGIIRSILTDFLTELDFVYGIGLRLSVSKPVSRPALDSAPTEGPTFSGAGYTAEAKNLYWYATTAREFPLLQYLAYYQILEFNFARLGRVGVALRLQELLDDSGFDPDDEQIVSRLVEATSVAHVGLSREEVQLRAALDVLVSDDELRTFISGQASTFLDAIQLIGGVERLDLDSPRLVSNVARRIYAIRNRIVHTDNQFGEDGVSQLLPASSESQALANEIKLVRWLAIKAMKLTSSVL
jgi:hypothetical protein